MRPRDRWRRRAIGGGIALVLAGGAVAASYAPVFEADHVVVRGNVHLRPGEIRRISGLTIGTNVIHADLESGAERLERNAWVADASARRELPSTIVIVLRERTPVGTTAIDGRDAVVMGDGTLLEGERVRRLPRIWLRGGSPTDRSLADLAAALAALSDDVRRQVAGATVRPDGSLVLQLRRGVVVVYGPPGEDREKARALGELLAWADRAQVDLASLDVTVPQVPTARTAAGAPVRP